MNGIPSIRKSIPPALFILFLMPALTAAQFYSISGTVTDTQDNPLPEASVILFTAADTLMISGISAGLDGQFVLRRVPEGSYNLSISYLGHVSALIPVQVSDQNITGLVIRIRQDTIEMDELEVTARPDPVQVRGDTTIFTAAAFPVHDDAVAEDLLRRMPGFTIVNGRVQAQGEEVRQVLVDGEEFFGDDPAIALRNLPAAIIRQIEVFDQASEQSEFTGFSDGETIRTVNIVTRSGIRDGSFGRANASLGTDDRYLGGGNINWFSGSRRISVLGLTNNINQINFTSDYLSGVAEASQAASSRDGGPGSGRGGGSGSGRGRGEGRSGGSGSWGGPDNTNNFLIGEQQGINNIHSFGINYIDRWNDSWRISSSYFFNNTSNTNERLLERQFLDEGDVDGRYLEESLSDATSFNHRFNARAEYTIDPRRSVTIRPRISLQHDDSGRNLAGQTFGTSGINETGYRYDTDNFRYDFNNSILYRRRFDTQGRTFSIILFTSADRRTGDQLQAGTSRFFDTSNALVRELTDDQRVDIDTWNRSIITNLQFTEPLTDRSQLLFGYSPALDISRSERYTYRPDDITGQYDLTDFNLSSEYDNREVSHRTSAGYRLRGEGFHFNATLSWQYTTVEGTQVYPLAAETSRTFSNLLPRAMLTYRFSETTSLRLMYNTRTRTPSVVQLQDVLDVTDPLIWSGGNPDLREQYVHWLSMRYRSINPGKQTALLGYVFASYTLDYIGTRTILAAEDTPIREGLVLEQGTRLMTPDQTGNAWDLRTFLNYSLPVPLIRSNANFNTGARYREIPSIINEERNIGRQTDLDAGVNLNSTISRNVDFSLAYTAGYRFVRNTLRGDLDDDYYTGRATARFTILPWDWLVLESDLNLLHYEGLADEFNRDITFWNASVGYRFLAGRAAQIRLTVTDILGQNSSINRVVTDLYIQDIQSNVLTRYFMLTFSYNFRAIQEGMR